jgi:hypothetical protein
MTLKEAYALLDAVPLTDVPSRINPSLTVRRSVEIVRKGIHLLGKRGGLCGPDDQISDMSEKRVHQVSRNQRRPRY